MSAVLESLQAKVKEQGELLRTLEMWEQVEAQGISADDVAGFTWRDDFITREQKRERLRAQRRRESDPIVYQDRPLKYNAVRMKDGTIRKLDPTIERPYA
jgi:hypothetical protein